VSKPHKAGDPMPPPAVKALIARHVIRLIGFPTGLLRVMVHPIGGDHYRVNVHVGRDAASSKIVGSYFLTVDVGGNILGSSPKIARLW
jgi:hypothetical protein